MKKSRILLMLLFVSACPHLFAEDEEVIEVDLEEMAEAFEDQIEETEDAVVTTLEKLDERFYEIMDKLDEQDELDAELLTEAVEIIEFLEEFQKQMKKVARQAEE